MEASSDKFVELSLISVEHIDVYITGNAVNLAVGTQLPIHQSHVGLILSVACYPYVILLLDVGSIGHVFVDEHLADVEDGLHTRALLHDLHKCAYALH